MNRSYDFVGSFVVPPPPAGLPEIAFAGRSNVGKSSALNALLGTRKAARTSRTPGRTRTINVFEVGGRHERRLRFVDLPGYGFARVSKEERESWSGLVLAYLLGRPELALVVVLVDANLALQASDGTLVEWLVANELPFQVVATKADRLTRNERHRKLALLDAGFGLADCPPLPFSARTGEGVDLVWDAIEAASTRSPARAR